MNFFSLVMSVLFSNKRVQDDTAQRPNISALLRTKKGFSLVECVMAIGLFALMSMMALRVLALSIMFYDQNNTLVREHENQLSLIADGSIFNVGDERVSELEHVQQFTGTNGDSIKIEAYYSSFTAQDANFFISKPRYDLREYEEKLLKELVGGRPFNQAKVDRMTDNKFFSTHAFAVGNPAITMTQSVIRGLDDEMEESFDYPEPTGTVIYDREYEYLLTFEAVSPEDDSIGVSGTNYATTIRLPPFVQARLVSAHAVNATVRQLEMTHGVGVFAQKHNYLRLSNMKGAVQIRLRFYYNSSVPSPNNNFAGYFGAPNVNLAEFRRGTGGNSDLYVPIT
ncbi:MAG: prepilin-type N-terminal cleavage/methylation domain-containing protein [Oscillospiraceae bacterium]|nr:prepilin-type N-terminal cleavage/methylation domain-containing protein [Oscillospiraceae bacterium]